MSEWVFEHSVQARVTPEAAWAFWTTVSNWVFDESLESVMLDGPFAAGAKGVTMTRGGQPIEWRIREASPGHAGGQHVSGAESQLAVGIPQGMRRLAELMEQAS